MIDKILDKAYSGKRLDFDEAVALFQADIYSLGRVADNIRRRYHPENIVTFVIDRNITFTNVCVLRCGFCAFSVDPASKDAYLLSKEKILSKVKELVDMGGTQVMLQGGIHPDLSLEYYCELLSEIKARFDVWLHSLSPAEIYHLAKISGTSTKDVLLKLKSAGLDSLPGAAEILVDRVRHKVSPHKLSTQQWLKIMEEAHSIGMHTTATMTFGMIETLEERIEHMLQIRNLQDRTGGFKAFIPWGFSPKNTKFSYVPTPGGLDYLKTLAIARIVIDNIPNIQAGWVTEGHKLAQLALAFGANDFGGILMEEQVIKSTGIAYHTSVSKVIELIRSAGRIPAQRSTTYEILKIFYN
jgi:cyclic dehypoxanthinyl futalosine synthase